MDDQALCVCGHTVSWHAGGEQPWLCLRCDCEDFAEDLTGRLFEADPMKLGSLCSGGGGLDLAIEQVFGAPPVWHAETDPAASAPPPIELSRNGNPRLNPAFSEWMMGWPTGWVTDPAIGISRNNQLKIIGNGVVPLQAMAAICMLLGRPW